MTSPVRCVYHCAKCGRHFTSLHTFDWHRAGEFRDGTRHCVSPEGAENSNGKPYPFEVRSENGLCDVGAEALCPVTVWGDKAGREKMAQAFSSARSEGV